MNFIYSLNAVILKKEEFDKIVNQILQKPEYRRLSTDYMDITERIRNMILGWIEAWIEKLFNAGDKLNTPAIGISNTIVTVGAVLLVIFIILLFLSMRKIVGKNKKIKTIYGEEINSATTAEGLRDKAKGCKNNGNYREAIRIGFISLLLKMNEKNLLYLDETKTNSEMLEILKKNGFEYIKLFQSLTYLFNEVWFGHKTIHEDEYSLWEMKMDELWNGVLSVENKK